LLKRAVGVAPFSGFAAFAVIEIHRHIATGVSIKSAIVTFTAINKKLMFVHDIAVAIAVMVNE
jgi:hypothetical protein